MSWLWAKILDFLKKNFPFIIIILSVLIITYPSIFHINNELIGDGGDNYQFFSYQHIASNKIKQLKFPLEWSNILRYPVGFNFGVGFDSVNNILIASFLSFFFNSIVTYNLTILTLLILNSIFSYYLFQYLSQSRIIGTISSIIYGYSFYAVSKSAGHINLMGVGGFPLLVYSLLKIRKDHISFKKITLLLFSLLYIHFSSFQYSLMLAYIFPLLFILIYFFCRNELSNFIKIFLNYKKREFLIILLIVFLIIAFIPSKEVIISLIKKTFVTADRSSGLWEYTPNLFDYIFPNNYLPFLITNFTKQLNLSSISIERVVFVGYLEIILFIFFIFSKVQKKIKIFLLANVLFFIFLSLGLIRFPHIPQSGRFYVLFYLFITIAITLFLTELKNYRYSKIFFFIILSLAIFERIPNKFWLSSSFVDKNFAKKVRSLKGSAVLDLPVSFDNSIYDIMPFVYDKKIVSGYLHYPADNFLTRSFVLNSNLKKFICDKTKKIEEPLFNKKDIIDLLKKEDVLTIVIHKNDPEDHAKFYFPECASARINIHYFLPHLLYLEPTDNQKIISLFFPGINNLSNRINIPYDGIFYIDGIHAYPLNYLPLEIYLNGKKIDFSQKWINRGDGNATFDPFLNVMVKKGDYLSFFFKNNKNFINEYSFIKIWYRFIIDNRNDVKPLTIDGVSKIYEDEDAAVFKIID